MTLKCKYLLIILEETPHQNSGPLFTVPNKLCVIRETLSIALFTAAAAPAAISGNARGRPLVVPPRCCHGV